MKKIFFLLAVIATAVMAVAQEKAPAFPGAEGHGRYVTGGRGKTVVHVTNLNDSGTGSFRSAVGTANRIVVFDVAGVIALKSDISFKDNITILGQTAPYPGITLRYYTVRPGANNIIRFIRFRRGSEKDTNDGADASWQRQKTGIVFDHCSFSWSIDEVASFYDNNNFTMQWCTLGESLNNAGHGKGAHGYGGIWGGKLASFHHNMICHVNNRSPRFCGARYDWGGYTSNQLYSEYKWQNAVQAENVDFRNCVVYNANGCYGGPGGGQINMVGNYYKSGPAATIDRITTASYGDSGNSADNSKYWTMNSRYYLEDNMIDGKAAGWEKMKYDNSTPHVGSTYYTYDENHYYGAESYTQVNGKDALPMKLNFPAPIGEITTHSATVAYEKIMAYCGASLYRDEVDERYMTELKNGTATYKGSVTGKAGRIDLVSDVKGYTEANFPTATREASVYTVKDGIPDDWARANGLDPTKNNAAGYDLDPKGFYTNIEVYANSLVQDIMIAENKNAESAVKEYFPAYVKADGTRVPAINDGKAINGTIEWTYTQGEISPAADISDAFEGLTANVTFGSNLRIASPTTFTNPLTTPNLVMTAIKSPALKTSADETTAIKFDVTAPEGYTFTPTNIAFKIAYKTANKKGCFATYWENSDGTQVTICEETEATPWSVAPYYTQVNTEVTNAKASSGTSSLVINMYNFYGNYLMGLSDIVISGYLNAVKEIEKGDANGDGKIDISDAIATFYKMIDNPSDAFNEKAADVNGDGIINVADVMGIINIINKTK